MDPLQGYHAAWSDADIALTQNVFTIFSRWFDLVATWAGGSSDPLDQIEKVIGYELKVIAREKIVPPRSIQAIWVQ